MITKPCKACKQPIVWAQLVGLEGTLLSKMPLDAEARIEPRYGLIAFNDATGRGKVLAQVDVTPNELGVIPAKEWAAKHRMTFHRTHFADKDCPMVKARAAGKRVNVETGEVHDAA